MRDVISLRVRVEVKDAWEQLTDHDKARIRDFVEELVLLHATGFKVDLVKRELDSLRAEICPMLIKIAEYYHKSACISNCYDPNVKYYEQYLYYYVQKLCKYYPAKPQGVSE